MAEEIAPTRARQGFLTGRVFVVLLTSLTLAAVAGIILYTAFYPFD